jgi:hypothetical protein
LVSYFDGHKTTIILHLFLDLTYSDLVVGPLISFTRLLHNKQLLNETNFIYSSDHVDERTVCNGIAPEKDVDGFHIINIGRLCLDQHSLIPATASAVWEIIKRTGW